MDDNNPYIYIHHIFDPHIPKDNEGYKTSWGPGNVVRDLGLWGTVDFQSHRRDTLVLRVMFRDHNKHHNACDL